MIGKRMALLGMVLLVVLGACAAQPLTLADMPLFSGAVTLADGEHSLADQVREAMQDSAEGQGLAAEFAAYTLPGATTWADLTSFYKEELTNSDWQSAPQLTSDHGEFQAIGWVRGSGDREQSFVVNYVPDLLGEGAFVLLGLLTEQP